MALFFPGPNAKKGYRIISGIWYDLWWSPESFFYLVQRLSRQEDKQ